MTYTVHPHVSKLEITIKPCLDRVPIEPEENVFASTLINKHRYFLEEVFIVKEETDPTLPFRLLVFHDDQLLVDQHYRTVRIAKNAFGNQWAQVSDEQKCFPKWSHFYYIKTSWFKTKLSRKKLNDINKGGEIEGTLHE